MNINHKLWEKPLIFVAIVLLTGCGLTLSPARSNTAPRQTPALPTRAPIPPKTPVNTRVIPIESLTPGPTPTLTPIPDEIRGLVVGVMDGRTIGVVLEGDSPNRVYVVRYLGIDTPPIEDHWGAAALEVNRKMTGLKVVRLVRDQSTVDSDGHLLRYVYTNEQLMSIILTEQGLARAAVSPPDTRFQAEITEAETRAKQGRLGLWSGTTPTPPPLPAAAGTITSTASITVTLEAVTPAITVTITATP
jgi:endonuclease YncB( thermonuclease family)